MNVLSLFDGISCGQLALQRAGKQVDNYYASEINPDSIAVTMHHFPNTIQLGDVTKIDEAVLKTLPKIDLLIGGSPCQDLSQAGGAASTGLYGARSSLFFEYIRIKDWLIKHNNENLLFLLENVKPAKQYLQIMNNAIGVQPIIINSALVSAQRRIRYYWTNINGGNIPQPKDKGLLIKDIVYDNNYKQFRNPKIEASKVFTPNYVKWDQNGKKWWSQSQRAFYLNGKMGAIPKSRTAVMMNIWLGGDLYRRGHPIEAERCQTLPDNYTAIIPSAGKRMGLCGDGWTVDVVAHIFSFI